MRNSCLLVVVWVIFLLASCGQGGGDGHGGAGFKRVAVDTADAKATFEKVKDGGPVLADSTYTPLLSYLIDSERYELAHRHVQYYGQLKGNRKNARALIARAQGWYYNYVVKYDSSIGFFNEALELYKELNATPEVADCYYGLGINYLLTARYDQAFATNYKALGIYEQFRDSANIYKIKTEIAVGLIRQKDYDKAIAALEACRTYYQREDKLQNLAYCISLMGQVYYNKKDFYTSLAYAEQALPIRLKLGLKQTLSASYNNIAGAHMALKQFDKAAEEFALALDYTYQAGDTRPANLIRSNIANCTWGMGKTKEAEQMVLAVLDSARQQSQGSVIAHAYMLLYNFRKKANDYEGALAWHERYKAITDSLFSQDREKTISELSIKYETQKKEDQIARLNSEKKADSAKKLTYLLVLLFTVITAALTISLLTYRNRRNKLAIEKARLELDTNARELQHFTESIISKNSLIAELETRLSDATSHAGEVQSREENQEQLSQLYQLKILTEEDWLQFKMLFDKVYPGLINRLRERYPGLAPAEERQCLLIKLKIDNKECADMLGISTESVRKNRYRLKKRFNLSEEDNLDAFVWGLE